MHTPIALFTYNRPEHAQRALTALAKCHRLDECCLFVFCDGAKSSDTSAAVDTSRIVVREWAHRLGAEVIEQVENRGLARSIVTGVTDLCERYGRAIVVEDDLVVSPDFLDYMLQALDRYEDDASVLQVSGYMFPVNHLPGPDSFFLHLSATWGWATWARAWRMFDWNATGSRTMLADSKARKRFDLDGSYPYSVMLKHRIAGKNDSWGILWWWAVFRAGGLVLHPRSSLVWNGGFDGSGTHCGVEDWQLSDSPNVFKDKVLNSPITWPTSIVVDMPATNQITSFLGQQHRTLLRWRFLRRRVLRALTLVRSRSLLC